MRKKVCGVYMIRNDANGKVYIGSSVDVHSRWRGHRSSLNRGDHHSVALMRAWEKYGEASFSFLLIEEVQDKDLRLELETSLIAKYGSANGLDGYNCLPIAGSPLGYSPSEEARKRMSAAQLKIPIERRLEYCRSFLGRKHTDETKAKMSANSRRLSPSAEQRLAISKVHKGKTISAEHKAAVAEACRKKNTTPEMREKVSLALKGRVFSDEHRRKISESCRGRTISESQKQACSEKLKGRVFSDEHRQNISAALRARNEAKRKAAEDQTV